MWIKTRGAVLPLLAVALAGCGSATEPGGSPQTDSSQLTTGVISGFGSVFVNGVKFESSGSQFTTESGTEDDLDVGMVVTVDGPVGDRSGDARHISYDYELEGIVLVNNVGVDGTGTLDVLGQTVNVDAETMFESAVAGVTSVDVIQTGNVVEVSGYSDDAGTIHATRIEVEFASHDGQGLDVKGKVSSLTPMTFTIGGLTIDYSAAVFDNIPNGVLSEGLLVEVESTAGLNVDGDLIASKVEGKDGRNSGVDETESEIEGIITEVVSGDEFEIGGRPVRIAGVTVFEDGSAADIAVGVKVEVEGRLDDQAVLIADKVEFKRRGEIRMEALVEAVDAQAGTITVLGKTISVDSYTRVKDNGANASRYFSVNDLVVGDRVKVAAFQNPTQGGQ